VTARGGRTWNRCQGAVAVNINLQGRGRKRKKIQFKYKNHKPTSDIPILHPPTYSNIPTGLRCFFWNFLNIKMWFEPEKRRSLLKRETGGFKCM